MLGPPTLPIRLNLPLDVIDRGFSKNPQRASGELLIADQDHFVSSVCKRHDHIPVNTTTRLVLPQEAFQQRSLWFSETLQAINGGDAGRTFIIYEPVAARHVQTSKHLMGPR